MRVLVTKYAYQVHFSFLVDLGKVDGKNINSGRLIPVCPFPNYSAGGERGKLLGSG
jgi:hypothetical protein